ncbi:hypothetical protein [Anaerorhabdus furcosa]|uniref:Uncharacterized protein n=1 Tax=Anaerorhabdus furcosa TaxID=118967 RepID=A0A1T4Q4M7_9FIRM|nr:hypothetical protein [Anaerorhabdus furcosa]SJZ98723.1 hypothetical protein SAMN02745191_2317 [Anaerorhabdus furcosa]
MKKITRIILSTLLFTRILTPTVTYAEDSNKNIKATSQFTDYNIVVSSDDVAAGGSKRFYVSRTDESTMTVGWSYEVAKNINTTIGLSTSSSITYSKTYANKTVRSCTITYFSKYQNYSYDRHLFGTYEDSGTAKVLVGLTQDVKYNY